MAIFGFFSLILAMATVIVVFVALILRTQPNGKAGAKTLFTIGLWMGIGLAALTIFREISLIVAAGSIGL